MEEGGRVVVATEEGAREEVLMGKEVMVVAATAVERVPVFTGAVGWRWIDGAYRGPNLWEVCGCCNSGVAQISPCCSLAAGRSPVESVSVDVGYARRWTRAVGGCW